MHCSIAFFLDLWFISSMNCFASFYHKLFSVIGLLFLLIQCWVPVSAAQEAAPQDTVASLWNPNVVSRLSASQAAYSNWQEGGLNTVAITASIDGSLERQKVEAWKQSYQVRLVLGAVKQDTLAFRKADDVIRLSASIQNAGKGFFKTYSPTLAVELRTQFAPGLNYDKNPFEGAKEVPVKVSDFFAPAIFQESIGLTYNLGEWFNQRLGVAGKETIIHLQRLRPLYGLDRDNAVRFELGLESHTELDREVFENVHVNSALSLFAAFNKANVPDMLWESSIAMEVNTWLGVNLEFVTLYDRDISRRIQFKEVFSLGFSFAMI